MKIAVLGPQGSYGEQAGRIVGARLGISEMELYLCTSHKAVIAAVACDESDYGVVAFRNTSSPNIVGESMAYLAVQKGIRIVGLISVPIDICLAGYPDTKLESVQYIHSHPQGFIQCSRLLMGMAAREMKHASTAAAAALVGNSGSVGEAALCSRTAAVEYGLEILHEYAANAGQDNATDFFVISRLHRCVAPTHCALTIAGVQDRPGGLRDLLNAFADQEINLDYIHSDSRPLQFFVLLQLPQGQNWASVRLALNGSYQIDLKGEYCVYASA